MTSSKLLQEQLSHYLDLVEVAIVRQISVQSDAFFSAMSSHDILNVTFLFCRLWMWSNVNFYILGILIKIKCADPTNASKACYYKAEHHKQIIAGIVYSIIL